MTAGNQRRREFKRQLLEQQNWRCAYCGCPLGMETATIDHVIALSRGGANDRDNLVAACRKCNEDKGRTSYFKLVDGTWSKGLGLVGDALLKALQKNLC